MDDKEIAVASLVLLGTTIESHLENGLSTPMFFRALELAVELAEEIGLQELTDRLNCLKMEVGERNNEIIERLEKLAEQVENSPELAEFIEHLTESED